MAWDWRPIKESEGLTSQQVLDVLAESGVQNIYATMFGDWSGAWSPWDERDWLYEDGYHFNKQGQRELRYRFQTWLRGEVQREGPFDLIIADSLFFTHDHSCPYGRKEQDEVEIKRMGFSSTQMRCGVGFVRGGGFARMIMSASCNGELTIGQGARVLLITAGNDLWCSPNSDPLYSEGWLRGHIQWVREALAPYTASVKMVSIIDTYKDWRQE